MDDRRLLQQVRQEWSTCEKCELGRRRKAVSGQFVFGEGRRRGIMVVGEGPGRAEEEGGRPFISKSGDLLRRLFLHWGVNEVYLTNLVSCRSCSVVVDENNQPRKNRRGIMYRDEAPLPTQIEECRPRLMEEIYLVDPIVVIAVGGRAAEALIGRPVTITRDRGETRHIEVPGAGWRASLTEKKGAWLRKHNGQLTAPVEQSTVTYLLIPTLHPAFVLRKIRDDSPESPFRLFASDIRKAVDIYERYEEEVYGIEPKVQETTIEEEALALQEVPDDDEDEYYE